MDLRAASLRQMRIVHAIFLVAVLLYVGISEQLAGNGEGYSTTLLEGIGAVSCFDVLLAYYFRRKQVFSALEKLRREPNDVSALKQWRAGTTICLVMAMSVALYGFVLRVMGASRRIAWPFFVLAVVLMLMWRPQLEFSGEVSETETNQ